MLPSQNKAGVPWLAGPGADGFAEALASARAKLEKKSRRRPVVVAEENPARFLAGVLATVEMKRPVVLASPRWGAAERAQAAAQLQPGHWLGKKSARWPRVILSVAFIERDWAGTILIPTGGTGGRVRWAVHTWATLAVAARGLAKFLKVDGCTHVSLLPSWHIGGLMPLVRALETNGTLWLEDWKRLETGHPPATPPERAIVSLVPTQLQRVLKHRRVVAWLRQSRAILIGGAAPLPGLLERARELHLPVALAYGMTETAAVVAAQTPADFLAGQPPTVRPLSHAKIWIGDDSGRKLPRGRAGRIWIEAKSLFAGYYSARKMAG
jgi:O-succinylbenzoic acid--CoA ligase